MTATWRVLVLFISVNLFLQLLVEVGADESKNETSIEVNIFNKTDQVGWLEPLTSGTELVAQETGKIFLEKSIYSHRWNLTAIYGPD